MLRDHLYFWRKNHPARNYQEYLDSIEQLPEEDRECTAGLWGIRSVADIELIIKVFHHVEHGGN